MKIAFVEPIKHIGFTSKLTPITLVNIQTINKQNINKLKKFQTVLIDNGVFEIYHSNEFAKSDLLHNVFNKQLEAALQLNNTRIILPDYPFNYKLTLNLHTRALSLVDLKYQELGYNRFIGVVQAKNYLEADKIIKKFKNFLNLKYISVPKRLREQLPNILRIVKRYYPLENVHLLGFNIRTDFEMPYFIECSSMDTSYPIKCCLTNTLIGKYVKRPANYLKSTLDEEECSSKIQEFYNWFDSKVQQIQTYDRFK